MKLRRSERMVVISDYLINNPYRLTGLSTFTKKYEAAKSSTSEDITIIKKTFRESEVGEIEAVTGVSGGVTFTPRISGEEAKTVIEELHDHLSESNHILPGGYICSSDLLGAPKVLQNVGRIIANAFKGSKIDAVMTVTTKGVPSANAVANILDVPFVTIRRDPKITEGSAVSTDYASGPSDHTEKIFLSKRSSKPNNRVLIVDGLLRGGGTTSSMVSLLKKSGSALVGVTISAENARGKRDRMTYKSFLKVPGIDVRDNHVGVEIGNISD